MAQRRLKIAISILLVVFSATVLLVHSFERLFPFVPAGLLLSGAVVVGLYVDTDSLGVPTMLVVCVALAHLIHMAHVPSSMIGTDPDRLALWTQALLDSGNTGTIPSSFYSNNPIFFLLAGATSLILDVSVSTAFLVFTASIAIVVPTTTAAIVSSTYENRSAALVAALLAVTAGETVARTVSQIPQVLGVLFWLLLLYVLVRLVRRPSNRLFALAGLFLLVSAFTHKISLLMIVAPLLLLVAVFGVSQRIAMLPSPRNLGTKSLSKLAVVGLLSLAIQWLYITQFVRRAIDRVVEIVESPHVVPPPVFTEAEPLNAGILSIASYSVHIVSLLLAGGLAWLALLYDDYWRDDALVLLSTCALFAGTVVFFVFAQMGPGRFHFYAGPVLAAIIAVSLVVKLDPSKRVVVSVVILLVALQLFVAPATPDYPDTSRAYLTASEADAKSFGEQYATGPIHTDTRFSRENLPENVAQNHDPQQYRPLGNEVFSGELASEYDCVAYRSGSDDIYSSSYGTYVLTWDIQESLETEFHRVHALDDTVHYCR